MARRAACSRANISDNTPDEDNETDVEWLQRAQAMSIMDESDCEELVAPKEDIV